jgi:hypothetical protein
LRRNFGALLGPFLGSWRSPKSDIFMPQSLRTRGRRGGSMAKRDATVGVARAVVEVEV